ncbi:MAG: serine/threonine protein kinase [Vicinamibacterales bacterium]|nr:serine/threonine protein kinase [Vicinamibacterales bacterium]
MSFLSDAALGQLREAATWPPLPARYACQRRLGRGGSATVYEARDVELERLVAIKVLDVPDRAGRAAARLAREALILARLDHPGIVPVHERGVLPDGRAFYVMKYVEGRPLDEAAALRPALADRLALFERVLETVAFAHAAGIVHRDLTPSNILVGEFGEVFVMDWGAALSGQVPEDEAVIAGTPGFMAPEQRAGGAVDARADVYALGTLLRALAGAGVPRALGSIVTRACAPDASARYPDARAMAADLHRFRTGLAPMAHREALPERLLRLYRRYELPVLLVLAYILMRAALLVWRGV